MKIRKHTFQNDKAWLNPPPPLSINKALLIGAHLVLRTFPN